jgi:pyruvate formate lyase activating enzyme
MISKGKIIFALQSFLCYIKYQQMQPEGIIFDLKKFAIHDGPGIRSTVFFKGCPLHCRWCHNPEGMSPTPEVMVSAQRCLAECRACIKLCPQKALAKGKDGIVLDRDRCDGCGLCAAACPAEALQMAGRAVSVESVMGELAKDAVFYRDSGGGVTFSGGEPLVQIDFLQELLLAAKKQGWHTAVDTCGHAPFAVFAKIMPLVDLFLFDLKIMDPLKHKSFTGEGNGLILDNLTRLSRLTGSLAIRIPLVTGFNDSHGAMDRMADFCASLPRVHPVHLLPYHRGGSGKRKRLNQADPLPGARPPTAAGMQKIKEIFCRRKLVVTLGG